MSDRSTSREGETAPACPQCGERLQRRHCKYVCPNHGPVVDCSDPFLFRE